MKKNRAVNSGAFFSGGRQQHGVDDPCDDSSCALYSAQSQGGGWGFGGGAENVYVSFKRFARLHLSRERGKRVGVCNKKEERRSNVGLYLSERRDLSRRVAGLRLGAFGSGLEEHEKT